MPPPSPSSHHPRIRIGNDVVDLTSAIARRLEASPRFRARILSPGEASWLDSDEGSSPPGIRLWSVWAAKETGFKVASKCLDAPPPFLFQEFETRLSITPGEEARIRISGDVRTPSGPVRLEGWADADRLHLVGWSPEGQPGYRSGVEVAPGPDRALESWREHFTAEEWEGIHSPPSAAVRIAVRNALAREEGIAPRSIEILTSGSRRGRTPPRVRVEGRERPELDLSISHHGRFVAWAVFSSTERGESAEPLSQKSGR